MLPDINLLLEKFAASRKKYDDEKERDLIKRVQNFDDPFAYKELQRIYKPIIQKAIQDSNITSVMDYDTALVTAYKCFKTIIKDRFNLNNLTAKPSTYILNSLTAMLKKERFNNRDLILRKSEDLSMKSEYINTAEQFLQKELKRTPEPEEIHKFITNNLKFKISLDEVKKIKNLEKRELSTDMPVGNVEGAEYMTFGDLINAKNTTPEDLFNDFVKQQAIQEILSAMPKEERRLIMYFYGLGQFKDKKAKSLAHAALSSNMTYYRAKQVIEQFEQKLREKNLL